MKTKMYMAQPVDTSVFDSLRGIDRERKGVQVLHDLPASGYGMCSGDE